MKKYILAMASVAAIGILIQSGCGGGRRRCNPAHCHRSGDGGSFRWRCSPVQRDFLQCHYQWPDVDAAVRWEPGFGPSRWKRGHGGFRLPNGFRHHVQPVKRPARHLQRAGNNTFQSAVDVPGYFHHSSVFQDDRPDDDFPDYQSQSQPGNYCREQRHRRSATRL